MIVEVDHNDRQNITQWQCYLWGLRSPVEQLKAVHEFHWYTVDPFWRTDLCIPEAMEISDASAADGGDDSIPQCFDDWKHVVFATLEDADGTDGQAKRHCGI